MKKRLVLTMGSYTMKSFVKKMGSELLIVLAFCSTVTAGPALTVLQDGVVNSDSVAIPQTLTGTKSKLVTLLNSGDAILNFSSSPWILFSGTDAAKFSKDAEAAAFMGASIAIGTDHLCAVQDGALKCWGSNANYQFGTNSTTPKYKLSSDVATAGPFLAGERVIQVAAGSKSTCAVFEDGKLRCWGLYYYADEIDGTLWSDYARQPTKFLSDGGSFSGFESGVTAVSARVRGHGCAIKNSGVWCWGRNDLGQLGNGTSSSPTYIIDSTAGYTEDIHGNDISYFPIPVRPRDASNNPDLTSYVTAVTTGDNHSCAIQSRSSYNGTLKCWGDNSQGQLGDGTYVLKRRPTTILTSGVSAVSAGLNHTCAIQSGALKCWGSNDKGQLGLDSNGASRGAKSYTPGEVYNFSSGVTAVAAGAQHTCAIKNEALYCWGFNNKGQLGNGTTNDQTDAWAVPGFSSGVVSLAAGDYATCALKYTSGSGKSLYCWGSNSPTVTGIDTAVHNSVTDPSDSAALISSSGLGQVNASHVISLNPGQTMEVPIAFTPGSFEGTASASVTFSPSNASAVNVPLSGDRILIPVIASSSISAVKQVGQSVTLSVTLSQGTAPSYQWKKNGTNLSDSSGKISGATTSQLTISNLTTSDTNTYSVEVSNSACTVGDSCPTASGTVTVQPEFGGFQVSAESDGKSFSITWDRLLDSVGGYEAGVTYTIEYTSTVDENGSPVFSGSGYTAVPVPDTGQFSGASITQTLSSNILTATTYWFRMEVNAINRSPATTTTSVTSQTTLDNRPAVSNLRILSPDASTPFLIPVTFDLEDRNYETDRIYVFQVEYRDALNDWQTEGDIADVLTGSIGNLSAGAPGAAASNTLYYNALRHFGTGQVSGFQLRIVVKDLDLNPSSAAETSPETLFEGMSQHASVGASFGACAIGDVNRSASAQSVGVFAILVLTLVLMALRIRVQATRR